MKMNRRDAKIKSLGKYFVQGFQDVIATMSGINVIETTLQVDNGAYGEISGLMVLTGKQNILVTVSMPIETATVLISYMTGSPREELPPEDLYDGVAELVNMVAGQAKTLASGASYRLKLTSPFSVAGKEHMIVHKNKIATFFKCFTANNMEILLRLYFL